MSEVLVLDQGFQPVGKVSWQRALTLFFQDKIEIVDVYEDREIRSATLVIKMPAVIRFLQALRRRKHVIKFSRLNVHTRDSGKCQYCGIRVPIEEMSYDHVVPRAQGGKTEWGNVVCACVSCNGKKSCRTPAQASMKLITKPVKPDKLPDVRYRITWSKGMPEAWGKWLGDMIRDHSYWNGELDQD